VTPQLDIDLERPELPEVGGAQSVEVTVEPGSQQRTTERHVIICIDTSGSMRSGVDGIGGPSKLDVVKDGIDGTLHLLDDRDYVSLVTFSSRVRTVVPITNWGELRRDELMGPVTETDPSGKTDIYGALERAHEELLSLEGDATTARRILLLSDGKQNTDTRTDPNFERLAEDINEQGVSIMAAGVGDDYNRYLLKTLADASQGNWHHLSSADELESFLENQFGRADDLIAASPVLEIDINPQFDAHDFVRHVSQAQPVDVMRTEDTVTVPLGDLVANERQRVMFELLARRRSVGNEYTVAEVRLRRGDDVLASADASVTYVGDAPPPRQTGGGNLRPRESHLTAKYSERIKAAETEDEFDAIERKLDEEAADHSEEFEDTFDGLRKKLEAARNDDRNILAQTDDV
jgi:Ca-activated chloride channel family protein